MAKSSNSNNKGWKSMVIPNAYGIMVKGYKKKRTWKNEGTEK